MEHCDTASNQSIPGHSTGAEAAPEVCEPPRPSGGDQGAGRDSATEAKVLIDLDVSVRLRFLVCVSSHSSSASSPLSIRMASSRSGVCSTPDPPIRLAGGDDGAAGDSPLHLKASSASGGVGPSSSSIFTGLGHFAPRRLGAMCR